MTSLVAASIPNPNSGRELPSLARQAGLKVLKTEVSAVSTPPSFFLRAMLGSFTKTGQDGVITTAELNECLEEQFSLQASGDLLEMWSFVEVTGTV